MIALRAHYHTLTHRQLLLIFLFYRNSAKPKHNYVLKYVSAAVGETDAPEAIPEFISQRRR
jgi:cellulose synthase/poly-beta-1,6-N-acetylglucosamine synthase-like glycosyltransferase